MTNNRPNIHNKKWFLWYLVSQVYPISTPVFGLVLLVLFETYTKMVLLVLLVLLVFTINLLIKTTFGTICLPLVKTTFGTFGTFWFPI